jgi:hypothetical protein
MGRRGRVHRRVRLLDLDRPSLRSAAYRCTSTVSLLNFRFGGCLLRGLQDPSLIPPPVVCSVGAEHCLHFFFEVVVDY